MITIGTKAVLARHHKHAGADRSLGSDQPALGGFGSEPVRQDGAKDLLVGAGGLTLAHLVGEGFGAIAARPEQAHQQRFRLAGILHTVIA